MATVVRVMHFEHSKWKWKRLIESSLVCARGTEKASDDKFRRLIVSSTLSIRLQCTRTWTGAGRCRMLSDPTTFLLIAEATAGTITWHIFNLLLHIKIPFKSFAKVYKTKFMVHTRHTAHKVFTLRPFRLTHSFQFVANTWVAQNVEQKKPELNSEKNVGNILTAKAICKRKIVHKHTFGCDFPIKPVNKNDSREHLRARTKVVWSAWDDGETSSLFLHARFIGAWCVSVSVCAVIDWRNFRNRREMR